MKENAAVDTDVTTISATDVDLNSNADIKYGIKTNALAETYFKIDTNTGKITVKAPVDREQYDTIR